MSQTNLKRIVKQTGKILIAEDDPDLLQIYGLLAKHDGYEVVTVPDGQSCINEYVTEFIKINGSESNRPPFDIVLLDDRMPMMKGSDVSREIMRLCPAQKLLMVTAYSSIFNPNDEELKKKIQVLSKPIDFEVLFAIISSEVKNA